MNDTITETLERLGQSSFRARFHLREKERDYVNRKGYEAISRHAVDFITTRIAPAFPRNDGRQTPMKSHPVFIAQHATATCCRGCIEKWHHIPKGRALSETEIATLVDLIMAWIDKQMTNSET